MIENMNKLEQIEFHWSKRIFKRMYAEVEVYGGQISFENDFRINLWSRAFSVSLSILDALLKFLFAIKWKTDYAGVTLWLGLFGFEVGLHLYKDIHWDMVNNCWVEPD